MTLTLTPPQPMVYGRARHPKGAVCRHLAHPAIYGVYHSNSKVVTVRGAHNPKCSLYTLNRYIIEASSQLLAVNFSRGMTLRLRFVERFTPDFRLLLLDPRRRARYDSLLLAHERGDQLALAYAQFLAGEEGESLLQRARRQAKTVGERLLVTWRDSPYL